MEEALVQASENAQELGIEVLDVPVKQINLPSEVSDSIYKRMRAERKAVANEHRSEGNEKAETIRAEVDRRVTVMLAHDRSVMHVLFAVLVMQKQLLFMQMHTIKTLNSLVLYVH